MRRGAKYWVNPGLRRTDDELVTSTFHASVNAVGGSPSAAQDVVVTVKPGVKPVAQHLTVWCCVPCDIQFLHYGAGGLRLAWKGRMQFTRKAVSQFCIFLHQPKLMVLWVIKTGVQGIANRCASASRQAHHQADRARFCG